MRTSMAICHNKIIPVYLKIKHATDESVKKYKTKSIARDLLQTEGVVYDKTLVLVNPMHFHPYYHLYYHP
jgi:hypothetical protein